MPTIFSETLRRIRKETGFSTAYRFFFDNGGAARLGFTYRQYLRMEQGKSLPESDKLQKLILALRVTAQTSLADELAVSWLRTFVGEDTYKLVFGFIPEPATPQDKAYKRHIKKILEKGRHYLTHRQFASLLENEANLLCFFAMGADNEAWAASEVAAALELPVDVARRSLARLAGLKLLKEVARDSYKCQLPGESVQFPHFSTIPAELREKFQSYMENFKRSGKNKWVVSRLVRADHDTFKEFLPALKLCVASSADLRTEKRTPKSALYLIEGVVSKLRNF